MKQILLLGFCWLGLSLAFAQAQDRTITGRLIDEKTGEGLPGVSVFVKGSIIGTVTDNNGNFSLTVPKGSTLTFQSVGLITQEVVVGDQASINLVMSQDIKELGEIIVNGYREQDKRSTVSSVATVKPTTIEQVPMSTFDQILQGQASGLLIQSGSGQPGTSATVLIRGISSINSGNDPLYVVDGVPINAGDFATINPNDFANVTVLKDASATSIYGSRGANGVVVITTKRGKKTKPQLNYRFMQGVSFRPEFKAWRPLNNLEKIDLEQELGVGYTVGLSTEEINAIKALGNTDWFREMTRNARTQSHEVNALGGGDNGNYYISLNYFSQEGIAIRSDLKRYTLRVNLQQEAGNFRFGTNLQIGYSKTSGINGEGGAFSSNPFYGGLTMNPYEPVYDDSPNGFNGYNLTFGGFNPIEFRDTSEETSDELKGIGNISLEYDVPIESLKGLTLRTNVGIDYRSRFFNTLFRPNSIAGSTLPGANPSAGIGGQLNNSWNRRVAFVITSSLHYAKDFGKNHSLQVGLYNEVYRQDFKSFGLTGFGLGKILTASGINEQAATPSLTSSNFGNSLLSYFADISYSFKDKYFLSLGARRDGSSRFGRNNQFANFYSVGAGWLLTEEEFMQNIAVLSSLKLRSSFGTTGNQEIGDFDDLGVFGNITYDGRQGIIEGLGNPDLKWETNTKFNIGIDFGILKNRISGTIDWYNEVTSDMFLNTQLSRTTGFSSLSRNIGKMRNRGLELSVTTVNFETNQFRWTTTANFTYNQNKVLKLYQGQQFELGTTIVREGLPYGTQFLVERVGVNPANGEYLWKDINGNITNIYNDANKVPLGQVYAPYFGGFTNTFQYKGLELSVFFTFSFDNFIINNDRFFLEDPRSRAGGSNLSTAVLNVWRQPGDVTNVAKYSEVRRFDSGLLEDASYLRLRNVTLSYSIPQNLMSRIKLRSIRIYAQGQNLLTFTKYTGFDPENNTNVTVGQYPNFRQFTFGADIGF